MSKLKPNTKYVCMLNFSSFIKGNIYYTNKERKIIDDDGNPTRFLSKKEYFEEFKEEKDEKIET